MKNIIIMIMMLLMISSVFAVGTTTIIEKEDANAIGTVEKVSFWKSLFAPTQQSVLESQIKSDTKLGDNDQFVAKLLFQASKHDASAYNIYVYLYDTIKKEYSPLVYTFESNAPLKKGDKYYLDVASKKGIGDYLSDSNQNHFIGVVGLLQLRVKQSELTADEIKTARGCNGESCWVFEKFNNQGQYGVNLFNPPFLYYNPQTNQCEGKTGYVGSKVCKDGNSYQDFVKDDCSKVSTLIDKCTIGESCSSGVCVKDTSCDLAGKTTGQTKCESGKLSQEIYNKDCKLEYFSTGLVCEQENKADVPNKDNLEKPIVEGCSSDISFTCADDSEVVSLKCVDGELQESGNLCPEKITPQKTTPSIGKMIVNPIEDLSNSPNQGYIVLGIIGLVVGIVYLLNRRK